MQKKKKGVDIIDKVLEACYAADKEGLFIMSLMHQYEDRGFLTKGQLKGLHQNAAKVADMPSGWLATIEAMIAKLPTRDKTPIDAKPVELVKDEATEMKLTTILAKYPQHKTVLGLQQKYQKEKKLAAIEVTELEKFYKLLIK
jgi:hypothetical protein